MRVVDDGEDNGWECLRCTETVKSAGRYIVEPEREANGSDSEFSNDFDTDSTDLSRSMGNYTEAEDYRREPG